jgi:hypothetical protein
LDKALEKGDRQVKANLFKTKKRGVLLAIGVLGLVAAGTALAVSSTAKLAPGEFYGPFKAQPQEYNPGKAVVSIAAKNLDHAGVGGSKSWILLLSRVVPYPQGASADINISPINVPGSNPLVPVRVFELGFDLMDSSYCTSSGPGFDVELVNGGVYRFGCADADNVGTPAQGWTTKKFTDADAQNLSGPPWPNCLSQPTPPPTSACGLTFLQVLLDEGPAIDNIDNITVNNFTIQGS